MPISTFRSSEHSDSRDQAVTIQTCLLCHASSLYPSPWESFHQVTRPLAKQWPHSLEACSKNTQRCNVSFFRIILHCVISLFLFNSDHALSSWPNTYPFDGHLEELLNKPDVLLAVRREIAKVLGRRYRLFPSGQRHIDNLDLFELAQVR